MPIPPMSDGRQLAATYHRSWRRVFWDHLWPAKHKWVGDTEEQDFKITVAARMKPIEGDGWLLAWFVGRLVGWISVRL